MISHASSFTPNPLPFKAWPQKQGIQTPSEAASGGYRALVVDGDAAMQKSLKSHLAILERVVSVDFADDGKAALEKALATRYDLIFLGTAAPGLDGYEICSRLRKMPEYKKTPIVMVADEISPMDAMKGVKAGCTLYLAKPLRQEALQKLGRRVMA